MTRCSLNCESNGSDLVALTETWLGSSYDKECLAELVPRSHEMKLVPGKCGGGVALLFKSGLSVKKVRLKTVLSLTLST